MEWNRPLNPTDTKIVDQLAIFLQIELFKSNSINSQENSRTVRFLMDILQSHSYNQELLRARLRNYPQLCQKSFSLLLCQIPESKICTIKYYQEEIERVVHACERLEYQNDLYFLIPNDQMIQEDVLNKIAIQSSTLMILSNPMSEILDLKVIMPLLQASVMVADQGKGLVYLKELYFKTLLYDMTNHMTIPLNYFVHQHQTDFLLTFKTYLNCKCSPSVTAEKLHIHRNSLSYRILKAREISGFMSEDSRDCQNFALAIQIDEYLAL